MPEFVHHPVRTVVSFHSRTSSARMRARTLAGVRAGSWCEECNIEALGFPRLSHPCVRARCLIGICILVLFSAAIPSEPSAAADMEAKATASAVTELSVTAPDGTRLFGDLILPKSTQNPVPMVVFTHGSGPNTRGDFIHWVTPFTEQGFGVLAFDKRGCGRSEGTYIEAPDLNVPAGDLIAWVQLLAKRTDVDVSRIGVMGWSQGGWVGPLAASREDAISFVVSISGPGVSPFEQNVHDKTNQCRASGATEAQTAEFETVIRKVWGYVITGENASEAQAHWDKVVEKPWFQHAYNGAPMMDRKRLLKDPRMQSYVEHSTYEPAPVLESLKIPMLAVFGDEDPSVPIDASIHAMKEAFRRGGNSGLTIFRVPGGDHGLRVATPDGMRTLHEDYPAKVVEWVEQAVSAQ